MREGEGGGGSLVFILAKQDIKSTFQCQNLSEELGAGGEGGAAAMAAEYFQTVQKQIWEACRQFLRLRLFSSAG